MEHCWIEEITDRVITPTLAEVWITAEAQDLVRDTEIQGRLIGPQCHYASTIEVAYPVQPLPRQPESPRLITGRVIIPEPSLWEPETPFIYRGPVIVFQNRQKWIDTTIHHGIRRLTIGPEGVRLNGKRFYLYGTICDVLTTHAAIEFRERGINTLVVPVESETVGIWEMADRLGFFILGRCRAEAACRRALAQRFHPSCLGWVLPSDSTSKQLSMLKQGGRLVGLESEANSSGMPISEIDFVLSDVALFVPGGPSLGHVDQG